MYKSELFKQMFDKYKERPIVLYGDPDVDGLESLYLMVCFCEMMGVSFSYYVNDNRQHGFLLDPETLRGSLVIAADFAITEPELREIVKHNVAVISTDHHDCQDTFIKAQDGEVEGYVWNNQYPFESEEDRYLSGAGVFYELVCENYPEFKSAEKEAVVGITLLSDARAIENPKAKAYLKTTYESEAEYIRYLIDSTLTADFGFGAPKMDRNYVDFTFSPTVNAMLRFNQTAAAINLVLGYGADKTIDWRGKQTELLNKMMAQVDVLSLPHCYILAVDANKFDEDITGFIGLLCTRYKNKNEPKSALIFAHKSGKVVRASFRGMYDGIEYRGALQQLGIKAEGHSIAFGITEFYPKMDLWSQIDQTVENLEKGHTEEKNIIEVNNLSAIMMTKGYHLASSNCFVRDRFRTYIKYNGTGATEVKRTYRMVELSQEEYIEGKRADKVKAGVKYKYELDKQGNKITKYIEYLVDGRKIKSFGTDIKDGLILPILEKGYIQLYVE